VSPDNLSPDVLSADDLLELFVATADAQAAVLAPLQGPERRARTDRPGQYALDLVADDVVVPMLVGAGLRVVSEESGVSGPANAPVTVVLDPVDGSTNCSREIPYWAISLCALDSDGPLSALVANQATGEVFTATRGGGAWVRNDHGERRLAPSTARQVEEGLIAVAGLPRRALPWKQFRALGSAALTLCDVAAGRVDGYIDTLADGHAAWDYLGGLLVCAEAGAVVVDVEGRELVTDDPDARRTLVAAGTGELAELLIREAGPVGEG
jgi:fructose-1,6-bisphosphatase/inositol monophosphatase family enzyme